MIARRGQSQAAELLTKIAREVRSGVQLLSQLLGTPDGERQALREELLSLEATPWICTST